MTAIITMETVTEMSVVSGEKVFVTVMVGKKLPYHMMTMDKYVNNDLFFHEFS